MKTDQYSILFSSLTGNTKKLADAIHKTLPQNDCEYFGAIKTPVPSSELLYIGFKQYHYRRIYVSGKNAAVCAGALCENERKS